MRYIFLLMALFLFQFCKNEKSSSSDVQEKNSEAEVQKDIPQGVNEDWTSFENAVGKMPSEVGLMQAKGLQDRIKGLLKDEEYQLFQKYWNQESPIVVEDRILYTTGCQSEDCKANKYLLFLDIADNNINIINFKYGQVKSWEERAVIGLPSKLLEQYESVRNDQGL